MGLFPFQKKFLDTVSNSSGILKKNNSKIFQPEGYSRVLCIPELLPVPPQHEAGGTATPISVKLHPSQ